MLWNKKDNTVINKLEEFETYKLNNREIFIDNISVGLANMIDSQIRVWNLLDDAIAVQDREPIKIYINCDNGTLPTITTILDAIKISKTPVYTFNTGVVGMAALFVYLAGHKRYCYPMGVFHFDPTDFDLTPYDLNPTDSQFYTMKDCLSVIYNELKRMLIEKTDIEETQLNKHMSHSWYISTEDAIKLRICNEICRKHFKLEREER